LANQDLESSSSSTWTLCEEIAFARGLLKYKKKAYKCILEDSEFSNQLKNKKPQQLKDKLTYWLAE